MSAYYNENDPKAAAWLRELIKAEVIAPGDVDERSIEDVTPNDLRGYRQHHFFAGIGGWSYALRLAGWSDDRPVWTGSCPCQPFSQAGKGAGISDERHLWPVFDYLIGELKPAVVFGEQVASPAGLLWLDLVSSDLEGKGYAVGAADLCAAGIGAPHIRQRVYWVADSSGERREGERLRLQPRASRLRESETGRGRETGGLAHANGGHTGSEGLQRSREHGQQPTDGRAITELCEALDWLDHADDAGPQGRSERRDGSDQRSPWEASLVDCRDGKRRPVEPGTFPLAHGIPGRVGLLRGYGNAIVPQVAEAFIRSYLDVA